MLHALIRSFLPLRILVAVFPFHPSTMIQSPLAHLVLVVARTKKIVSCKLLITSSAWQHAYIYIHVVVDGLHVSLHEFMRACKLTVSCFTCIHIHVCSVLEDHHWRGGLVGLKQSFLVGAARALFVLSGIHTCRQTVTRVHVNKH